MMEKEVLTENTDKKDFITFAKERIGLLPIEVKVKKLDEKAVIPTYAHNGDVGMDMTAISVEYDEEKDMYIYHTGLAFESEYNIGQFLFPRSSNRKTDAYLCNSVGIADSAIYRGEILFCYKNRDSLETIANLEAMKQFIFSLQMTSMMDKGGSISEHIKISTELYDKVKEDVKERARNLEFAPYKVGDKIGQMVFMPHPTVKLRECENLSETVRGENGFGSTGN